MIAYLPLFFGLLYLFIKYFKLFNKKDAIIIMCFFLFYNVVLLIDYKINFLPNLPDTSQYLKLFEEGEAFEDMSSSLNGYLFVIKYLRIIFLKNMLIYISFQVLLYFFSSFIILKSFLLVYPKVYRKSLKQIYLILSLALPSAFLYHLVPLREGFSNLGFAISLYFLLLLIKKSQLINLGFISGLFFIIFTRLQVAFYFIIGLISLKFSFDKHIIRKIVVILIGASLFIVVLGLTNYQLSPVKLAAVRNFRVLKYAGSYGIVEWNSILDILLSSPILILQFLFSPIPFLHNSNPFDMQLIFVDALFMFFMWLVVSLNIVKIIKEYKVWFILMALYLFLFGIYEFNIGGAVRHRLPLSLMTIALASNFIAYFFVKFNKRFTFEKN